MKPFPFLFIALLVLSMQHSRSQQPTYRYQQGRDYSYHVSSKLKSDTDFTGQRTDNFTSTLTSDFRLSISNRNRDGSMDGRQFVDTTIISYEFGSGSKTLSFGQQALDFRMDGSGQGIKRFAPVYFDLFMPMMMFDQKIGFIPVIDGSKLGDGAIWTQSYMDTTETNASTCVISNRVQYHVTGREKHNGIACYAIDFVKDADITGVSVHSVQTATVSGTQHITGSFFLAIDEGILVRLEMDDTRNQTLSQASGSSSNSSYRIHTFVELH